MVNGGYRNTPTGTDKIFIEDVITKPLLVKHPQRLWARPINLEYGLEDASAPLIQNHGGVMWILGAKSEGPMNLLHTRGGFTDIRGALLYPTRDVPRDPPLFINDDDSVSLTYFVTQQVWPLHVRETAVGITRELAAETSFHRGVPLNLGGSVVPVILKPQLHPGFDAFRNILVTRKAGNRCEQAPAMDCSGGIPG